MSRILASFMVLIACSGMVPLFGQDVRFPEWAREVVALSRDERPPARADAWVLLDRTEFLYGGGGEIQIKRFRLVKVLTERGVREGVYSLSGLGGKASKVKQISGWNLPDFGPATEVHRKDALLVDPDGGDELTSDLVTTVALPNVGPGSLVAFESKEVSKSPLGPVALDVVSERNPIRTLEVEADNRWFLFSSVKAEMVPRNMEGWVDHIDFKPGRLLRLRNVRADVGEDATPAPFESRPHFLLRFLDDAFPAAAAATWSDFGSEWARVYAKVLQPIQGLPVLSKQDPATGLRDLYDWMGRNLAYKVVYLTGGRGWVPDEPGVVMRRRGGDCKDLASFLLSASRSIGIEGYPCLARIGTGRLQGDEPVHPLVFNHAIAALELPRSFGLAAEVVLGARRYLLVDPTDSVTPFGQLGPQHTGGKVLMLHPRGGQWVEIPEASIHRPDFVVKLTGEVTTEGVLSAALAFSEKGNAGGLKGAYQAQGRKGLEAALVRLLSRNAGCMLQRLRVPESVGGAFRVEVDVSYFIPLPTEGGFSLPPLGLPWVPPGIQHLGFSRKLPVAAGKPLRWQWEADLNLPSGWKVALGEKVLSTGFREARWTTEEKGGRLRLAFHMESWEQTWPLARRLEGLQAVQQDRDALSTLLRERLSVARSGGSLAQRVPEKP